MNDEPYIIPDHNSPVRHLLHECRDDDYTPLATLEEARAHPNGVVILEGDWGGIIFATCPVKYVKTDHDQIISLCKYLEASIWPNNVGRSDPVDEGGWGVFYEAKTPGEGVAGGMGGGIVVDGLWIHPKLVDNYGSQINTTLTSSVHMNDSEIAHGNTGNLLKFLKNFEKPWFVFKLILALPILVLIAIGLTFYNTNPSLFLWLSKEK